MGKSDRVFAGSLVGICAMLIVIANVAGSLRAMNSGTGNSSSTQSFTSGQSTEGSVATAPSELIAFEVSSDIASTAMQQGIAQAVINPNVKVSSARASACLTYGSDYRVTFTIGVRNSGSTKSQKIHIRVQSADGGSIVQWNDISNVHRAYDKGGGLWAETLVTGETVGPRATKIFKFSVDFYYNPNRVNLNVFNGEPSYGLLVSGYFSEKSWQTNSSFGNFC